MGEPQPPGPASRARAAASAKVMCKDSQRAGFSSSEAYIPSDMSRSAPSPPAHTNSTSPSVRAVSVTNASLRPRRFSPNTSSGLTRRPPKGTPSPPCSRPHRPTGRPKARARSASKRGVRLMERVGEAGPVVLRARAAGLQAPNPSNGKVSPPESATKRLPFDARPAGRERRFGAALELRHALRLRPRAVSLPLIPLALCERTSKLFGCLTRLGGAPPYLVGVVLIAVAAYVLYTATPYFELSGS